MSEEEKLEKSEEIGRPGFSLFGVFGLGSLVITTLCFSVLLGLLIVSAVLNVFLGWELSGLQISMVTRGPEVTREPVAAAPPTSVIIVVPAGATPNSEDPDSQASVPTETPLPLPSSTAKILDVHTVEPAIIELTSTASPQVTSLNSYSLIPLEGRRDQSRPAEENPDLNLKLREPELVKTALSVVDIPDTPKDPDAPKLGAVFEPNFLATYTVHDWDWDCDCIGELLQDEHLILVGIATTPGQPIYIPHRQQDIYQGKYYAVVVYASEDSLTFMYHRGGTVAAGYTVHYEGVQTDPNLLALYQSSKGGEAPGLTLDTPIGTAISDELIVSMRDYGTFLDTRSRKDWWE